MSISKRFHTQSILTGCALVLGASAASAHDVYLRAVEFDKPLPGVAAPGLKMWGYSECNEDFTTCAAPSSPGPQITVPVDQTSLRIHLQNNLTAPTSVYIPGQMKALVPHRTGDRIDSFDVQTDPGATSIYTWPNLRSGTYLYQSGTHVQMQVQMGLYGAVAQDVACGAATCAYAGVPYDLSKILVYSEIDPALHAPTPRAVNATARSADGGYAPRYFLINGEPYSLAADALAALAPATGQRVLLRLVNAGLENHAPEMLGGYFRVVAEDGNVTPTSHYQYNVLLPAAKTLDLLFTPLHQGTYPLLDRRLRLVNDNATGGGQMAKLAVNTGDPVQLPTAIAEDYPATGGSAVPFTITAPGVLANDLDPDAPLTPLQAELLSGPTKGGVVLNPNGSFTYTPTSAATANGQDKFFYMARNGTALSDPAAVTINFSAPANQAPLAVADVFYINSNTARALFAPVPPPPTTTWASPGVLALDSDPNVGDLLSVAPGSVTALVGGPAGATLVVDTTTGATKGQVALTYAYNWLGDATFNYAVQDNAVSPLISPPVTEHIVRNFRITSATNSNLLGYVNVTGLQRVFGSAVTYELLPQGTCTAANTIVDTAVVNASSTDIGNLLVTNAQTLRWTGATNAQRALCPNVTVRASGSIPATWNTVAVGFVSSP